MVVNIILAAIASICQLINAFLGRKLAGKSPTPTEQEGYDISFVPTQLFPFWRYAHLILGSP